MIKWEFKTGDEELKKSIQKIKEDFDEWFGEFWENRISRDKMLSEESPVRHVYYKVCKSFEEVKKEYPYANKEQCNFCDNYVEEWFEGTFSNLEYECGDNIFFNICHKCIKDINKMEVTNNYLHKKDRNNDKNK